MINGDNLVCFFKWPNTLRQLSVVSAISTDQTSTDRTASGRTPPGWRTLWREERSSLAIAFSRLSFKLSRTWKPEKILAVVCKRNQDKSTKTKAPTYVEKAVLISLTLVQIGHGGRDGRHRSLVDQEEERLVRMQLQSASDYLHQFANADVIWSRVRGDRRFSQTKSNVCVLIAWNSNDSSEKSIAQRYPPGTRNFDLSSSGSCFSPW